MENIKFISLWEGPLVSIKGCYFSAETRKIICIRGKIIHFADRDKLKANGIEILRGQKKKVILNELGFMITRARNLKIRTDNHRYRVNEKDLQQVVEYPKIMF